MSSATTGTYFGTVPYAHEPYENLTGHLSVAASNRMFEGDDTPWRFEQ
ncbi:MAG: hypothetical protein U0936_09395 [Planctomycetaceae bacterium]